jgi:hypothetical protein
VHERRRLHDDRLHQRLQHAPPRLPQLIIRRLGISALVISLALAAYAGFRLPNAWSATLAAVSITDGFHRRFLVGTLLHPLALLSGYDYRLFAAESFAVLALLIAALAVAIVRTRSLARRALIIVWLLLPTGGFLFNEVGYFDQWLYLLLFTAVWLLRRERFTAAAALVAASGLVHEIAILTTLPIFMFAAAQQLPLRRAIRASAPAVAVNLLALVVPPASPGAVARLTSALRTANFTPRREALALFERSQSQSWQLYSVPEILAHLAPAALLLVAVFLFWQQTSRARAPSSTIALGCGAIVAPAFLALAGWDVGRWAFLLVSDFVIVLWLSVDEDAPTGWNVAAVLGFLTLIALFIHMPYFDEYRRRELTWESGRAFIQQVRDRSLFEIPGV